MTSMLDNYASEILLELKRQGRSRFAELSQVVENPRTLSRKLKMLNSMGLIDKVDKVYFLSEEGERAAGLVEEWNDLIESPVGQLKNLGRIPHPTFAPVLRRYCGILRNHFSGRLLGVLLFGSVARGDWTEDSDIDLLVVVDRWDKKSWRRSEELLTPRKRLRKTIEYSNSMKAGYVPIIQHYPLDVEETSVYHRIYPDAVLDGIILYEKDGFMTGLIADLKKRLEEEGAKRVVTPRGVSYWEMKPGTRAEGSS